MNYVLSALLLTASIGIPALGRKAPDSPHRIAVGVQGPELLCDAHKGQESLGFVYEYQEPGNPDHKEPTKVCSHQKGRGVACACHQACDNTENDSSCKSYCYKKWCMCQVEDCD